MSEVEECKSEAEVLSIMNNLPLGLLEAYNSWMARLHRLGPLLKERIFKVLHWICIAYRPLSIDEVAGALLVSRDPALPGERDRTRNLVTDIIDICSPIVQKDENGFLRFIHITAQHYLLDELSEFFISTQQAHLDIALSYVLDLTTALKPNPTNIGSLDGDDRKQLVSIASFGLRTYGDHYWVEHVAAYFATLLEDNEEGMELLMALRRLSRAIKSYEGNLNNLGGRLESANGPRSPELKHL